MLLRATAESGISFRCGHPRPWCRPGSPWLPAWDAGHAWPCRAPHFARAHSANLGEQILVVGAAGRLEHARCCYPRPRTAIEPVEDRENADLKRGRGSSAGRWAVAEQVEYIQSHRGVVDRGEALDATSCGAPL